MSLPNKRIKKIRIPDPNNPSVSEDYEIIPDKLQGTNTQGTPFEVTVPQLRGDDTLVTVNTDQIISGGKQFNGAVCITEQPLQINTDAQTTYTGDDLDASFFADKIEIYNNDTSISTTLLFPETETESTLATTDDVEEVAVELDDITALGD